MSAEPSQITNTEIWTQWEGKLVNGAYLLRRFLGSSSHNGVFLTEQTAEKRTDAAIKFVPADTVQAEAQLVQWGANATLSHPNLVRIFDVGRYRYNGRDFLFIVTEYADQTLAEILPKRPLAPEEVRELLLPTFDALLFLHRKGLIHGRLRPSNFLAVNDRLKLASDTIHPINHTASGRARSSAYDPPEIKERGVNAAGDIWSLGMTLLEALTQRTTAWPDDTVTMPDDLPAQFANVVQKCLSVAPAARPTVLDLETHFKAAPPQPAPAAQSSARQAAAVKVAAPKSARKQNSWRRKFSLSFSISLAAWIAVHFLFNSRTPSTAPAAPAPVPVAPAAVAKPAEPAPVPAAPTRSSAPTTKSSSAVLHQVVPDVPAEARDKIRGRIHVTVRVVVDPDGNVYGSLVEKPGPNKNFASLAKQAAEEWKFAPTPRQLSRVWLVLFVFSRNGVTAEATAQ